MRKILFGRLLASVLVGILTFSSAVPVNAMEGDAVQTPVETIAENNDYEEADDAASGESGSENAFVNNEENINPEKEEGQDETKTEEPKAPETDPSKTDPEETDQAETTPEETEETVIEEEASVEEPVAEEGSSDEEEPLVNAAGDPATIEIEFSGLDCMSESDRNTYISANASQTGDNIKEATNSSFTLSPPECANYVFTGWTVSEGTSAEDVTISGNTITVSAAKMTPAEEAEDNTITIGLTANWHYIYHVKFLPNPPAAGLDVEGTMEDQEFEEGVSEALTANAYSITGWTFTGWYTFSVPEEHPEPEGTAYTDEQEVLNLSKTPGDEVSLYGQWRQNESYYTIVFDPNDNSAYYGTATGEMENQIAPCGQAIKISKNLYSRAGYTFGGWNLYKWGSYADYEDEEVVTDLYMDHYSEALTVTLYAYWIPNDEVTVTLDSQGGSYINPKTFPGGVKLYDVVEEDYVTPTKTGNGFAGWFTQAEGGEEMDFATTPVTESATYYAHWTPWTYKVKFDANAPEGKTVTGEMPDQTGFTYGTPKALSKNTFECDGSVFTGWNTSSDPVNDPGTAYKDEEAVNILPASSGATVTLYGQWRSEDECMVTFTVGQEKGITPVEPSAYPSQKVTKGEKAQKPTENPTRVGFDFTGWFEEGSTTAFDFKTPITKDTNLNAGWKAKKYTLAFDTDGGKPTIPAQTFTLEQEFKVNSSGKKASKIGYRQNGWLITLGSTSTGCEDGYPVNSTNAERFVSMANGKGVINAKAIWVAKDYNLQILDGKDGEEIKKFKVYDSTGTPREVKISSPNTVNVKYGFDYSNLPSQMIYGVTKPGEKLVGFVRNDTGEKVMPGSALKLTKEPEDNAVQVYPVYQSVKLEVTATTDIPETKKATKVFYGGKDNSKTFGPETLFGTAGSGFKGYSSSLPGTNFFGGPDESNYSVDTLMAVVQGRYLNKSSSSSSKSSPQIPSKMKIALEATYTATLDNSFTVVMKAPKNGSDFSAEGYSNKPGFGFVDSEGEAVYIHKQNVLKGELFALTGKELEKKGSTLTGWKAKKIDTEGKATLLKALKPTATIKDNVKPGEILELTAELKENAPSKVTYVLNGGKYQGVDKNDKLPAAYSYNTGEIIDFTAYALKMVKKGYDFTGFYKDKNLTEKVTGLGKGQTVEDGAITVYCGWEAKEYQLELKNLEGAKDALGNPVTGGSVTESVKYDQTIDLSKYDYTKGGYQLTGWKDEKSNKVYSTKQKLKNLSEGSKTGEEPVNYEISAVFKPNATQTTFDLAGGKLPTGVTNPKSFTSDDEKANENGVKIATPDKKGYIFTGMEEITDALIVTNVTASEAGVHGDLEAPKKVSEVYIKRDPEKADIKSTKAKLKATYKPIKYAIIVQKDGSPKKFVVSTKSRGNKLIDESAPLPAEEFTFTDKVNLSAAASAWDAEGKGIKGFATSKGGPVVFNTTSSYAVSALAVTVTESPEKNTITLYAVEGDSAVNRINYDLDDYPGATLTKSVYSYTAGKETTLPKATLAGYTFKKWKAVEYDGEGNPIELADILTPDGLKIAKTTTGSVTLVPELESITYAVKVDPNGKNVKLGGEAKSSAFVYAGKVRYADGKDADSGNVLKLPNSTELTREGYNLVGYGYTKKKVDISLDAEAPLKGLTTKATTTVYAIWEGQEQSIEYSEHGQIKRDSKGRKMGYASEVDLGSFVHNMDTKYKKSSYGTALTLPKPSVEGFAFVGWRLDSEPTGTSVVKDKNGYVTKVKEDNRAPLSFTAELTENVYTFTYNFNGGAYSPWSRTKGSIKNQVYYTQPISYYLYNQAYKKGCKYIGNGLTSKAVSEIPASRLTSKNKGKATVYAVYEKVAVTAPGNVSAVYNIGEDTYLVTVEDNSLNTADGYVYEFATDPLFLHVVASKIQTREDDGDEYYKATLTGEAGQKLYVRVKAYATTYDDYKEYEVDYAVQSKWSKTVRAAKPFTASLP